MKGVYVQLTQQQPIPLDVELVCQTDQVVALVGPSGSGKTTVIRSIAGLYKPDHGTVLCQNEVWLDTSNNVDKPPHKRTVGLVFQNYALFPHYTALQNVVAALPKQLKYQAKKKAQTLLQKVHLSGLENRYPSTLSGGQQQRVAVARALAREPKVLLLDEPFSSVDQVTRRRLYRELIELRRSLSVPIIIVTHDLEEASLLADKMYILHKGITLQSGTPIEVAAQPASALVARLMDQQNIFTAQILEHNVEQQKTLINWCSLTLEAHLQTNYAVKQPVCWMIQSANVLLHRRDRISNGDRENPLSGIIIEYLILGGYANIVIQLEKKPEINITMSVPIHVAQRNRLKYGEHVNFSLLAKGIHLMPYIKLR